MRKVFVILAFLAFTFNVKADYAPIDIQIAEGEEYVIDQIVAAQVINQTSWDGQYILTGGLSRVYIDFLPRDGYIMDENTEQDFKVFYPFYVEQYGQGWAIKDSSQTLKYQIVFNSPFDAYQWLISSPAREFLGPMFMLIYDDEDGNGEYLKLGHFLEVGHSGTSSSNPSLSDYKYNLEELTLAKNRTRFLSTSDILEYAQVPINGVHITITNASGQVTQDGYRDILLSMKSVLEAISNKLGTTNNLLSDVVDGLGDIYENELLWHTEWSIFANSLTNLLLSSTNNIDYTELLKYYIYSAGNSITNNQAKNNLQLLYMYPEALSWNFGLSSVLDYEEYNKLYGNWYEGIASLYQLMGSSFWGENPAISMFQLSQDILKYNTDLVLAYNDFERKDTALSWLTLATNDISSLPYWLNQQATGGNLLPGQTNSLNDSEYRFNLLTNQYAQISLTGSNPSNSGENWNYFKRLEMLLAAIVYKQTDLSKIGEADDDNGTELANDTTVSAAVSAAEQDVSTSLSTVASSLSLTGLESSKNNLVSLWQIAVGAFDTPGSKPQITIFEQDEVGGDNNSSGAVNLDFSQGAIGDFCDFCHHLFGFLWSFGSLFIFWKVAKYCWDMGYRVVRFHYSLCRKFLGI